MAVYVITEVVVVAVFTLNATVVAVFALDAIVVIVVVVLELVLRLR